MTRLVCDQSCMHVAHLAGREETQTTPRVRHMVVFLQSGNDPCGEVHHFQQPGTVGTRTISINRDAVSHTRDNEALNDG